MVNCTSCGSPSDPGDRFCRDCGKPLTDSPVPRQTTRNPFRTLKTRWAIPWAILGVILAVLVLAITLPDSDAEPRDPTVALIAGNLFYGAITVWMVWRFRRSGIHVRRLVGRLPANYNWFPMAGIWLATVVFSAGALMVVAYAISLVAPDQIAWLLEDQLVVSDDGAAAYPVLLIATLVIIAPLFEEVFFRGVLINRWGIKWGFRNAIIASALLFGIGHAIAMVGAFMFGMVAAILYIRTRTLLVPIAMHITNNLLVIIVSLAFPGEGELDTASTVEEVQSLVFVGVALLVLTIPVLVWYLRKNWPSREEALPYEASGDEPSPVDAAGGGQG